MKSRETYDEFLKLLNLFSREIIDARTLVTRAETYLGDGELYHQFKDLMGWDVQRDGENKGPPGSIRDWTAQQTETEERYGKSYRRLPISVSLFLSKYVLFSYLLRKHALLVLVETNFVEVY